MFRFPRRTWIGAALCRASPPPAAVCRASSPLNDMVAAAGKMLEQMRCSSIHEQNAKLVMASKGLADSRRVDPRARMQLIRNIGIVAHIDAGKTTTTERILFFSGSQNRMGDVDRGTTTTDFLEEETARGITITAAAVQLMWRKHEINLIDTPGHVDFAVEVERSLRVLDGVIAVFDAAVGVQAQSYSVLRMAKRSRTPVIGFINKMDKSNADFTKAVASIRTKLKLIPLLVQLPMLGDDGGYLGVLDVVNCCSIVNSGERGENLIVTTFENLPPYRQEAITQARSTLVAELTAVDDTLTAQLIEALDATGGDEGKAELSLKAADIHAAIRRQLLRGIDAQGDRLLPQTFIPILCGAARRNMGVQPLMDAATLYLPSPIDRPALEGFSEGSRERVPVPAPTSPFTLALCFKVMFFPDPRKANLLRPLVFIRCYCGQLSRTTNRVRNQRTKEELQLGPLFVLQGNALKEVEEISVGGIGAFFSDKFVTGDTLFVEQKNLVHRRSISPEASDAFHSFEPIDFLTPVVSHAVEADHTADIDHLKRVLGYLSSEDPTFVHRTNEHGQLVVSGMGELHIEVIMSRMRRQFAVSCSLAKAVIEYREGLTEVHRSVVQVIGTTAVPRLVEVTFEIRPLLSEDSLAGGTLVADPNAAVTCVFEPGVEAAFASLSEAEKHNMESSRTAKVDWKTFCSAAAEASQAVSTMGQLHIKLVGCVFVVTAARRLQENLPYKELVSALQRALSSLVREVPKPAVLEPIMDMTILLSDDTYRADVFSLLTERLASSIEIDEEESIDGTVVKAVVPMRTVVRFSGELRKSSKGNAHYWTTLRCYRPVLNDELRSRILHVLGH